VKLLSPSLQTPSTEAPISKQENVQKRNCTEIFLKASERLTKERDGTRRIKTKDELDELIRHKNIINHTKAQRLGWFGYLHRIPED